VSDDQIRQLIEIGQFEEVNKGSGGNKTVKRFFDLILGLVAAAVLLVIIVVVAVLVRLTSPGPALYWSDRVGRHNKIFKMPKFRSSTSTT